MTSAARPIRTWKICLDARGIASRIERDGVVQKGVRAVTIKGSAGTSPSVIVEYVGDAVEIEAETLDQDG